MFSLRYIILIIVQVALTAALTYWFVSAEYRDLSQRNLDSLESFLIAQKQTELKNYTSLAVTAIDNFYYGNELATEAAQKEAANTFNRMLYNGIDGYFFTYDQQGTNIVLPNQPERVGKNYWELTDPNGGKTIQILIELAQSGGGYHFYQWQQPSTQQMSDKLSYATYLEKWDWMVGTGIYLGDVNAQLQQIQQTIDSHVDNTRGIILLVALSSISLICLFAVAINLTQKKENDEKVSALGQKIITLQEEERRHIARDLHDGIVQMLVSIKYSLQATTMQVKRAAIDTPAPLIAASDNLDNAIDEIRRISHHLHPQILDELGLSDAIESLAQEFTQRTNIEVTVTKLPVRKLLNPDINTSLYRVVQECLTNIEKHAHATSVNIELSMANKHLRLKIADNGTGMTNDNNLNGIGLRNMQERMEFHLGTLTISSSSFGTTVTAILPVTSFAHNFATTKDHTKGHIKDHGAPH